jgi:hypothetical protein
MNNAQKMLDTIFGERMTLELSAGKNIDNYRSMKIADDDIVEKMLLGFDSGLAMITLGREKDCQGLIDAGKKVCKQDVMVIASLAFEAILQRDYLESKMADSGQFLNSK